MRSLLLAGFGFGCAGPEHRGDGRAEPEPLDPGAPTRSGTMVAFGDDLAAVNAWDGTVTRVRPGDGSSSLVVGGEPTRLAVVGDELWVTLRAERAVAILRGQDDDLVEVERLVVGAEPYGVVASEDEGSVYVALSQQDTVVEVDVASRTVLRSWPVGDDPRWLAMHPSADVLYVTRAFDATVAAIDLVTGSVRTAESPALTEDSRPLASRATGDPAVSPDGASLVVPVVYVDNLQAGPQPTLEDGAVVAPPLPYYVSEDLGSAPVGRFNPALAVFDLADARWLGAGGPTIAVFVPGVDLGGSVRGYVASATYGPGTLNVLATLEGDDAVALIDLTRRPESDVAGEFAQRDKVFFDVGENPCGVVNAADGRVWVHERGTRSVASLDIDAAVGRLDTVHTLHADERHGAGESLLDPELEAGRHLFYSATDPVVSTPGSGVSCNTCHFDGRNDGWTWEFDADPRQTPSLAGPVSETAPVTWTDAVATVADEAVFTAIGRMGGAIGPGEADLVATFVDWTRDVDVPTRGTDDPLVVRGAALFNDPIVACAICHSGPRYTDNGMHELHDKVLDTPTLVGVSATPPYFHDGSAATLRDVLEQSADGSMGSTAGLSDGDLDALEAFLTSL